jgi:hypothetical protein
MRIFQKNKSRSSPASNPGSNPNRPSERHTQEKSDDDHRIQNQSSSAASRRIPPQRQVTIDQVTAPVIRDDEIDGFASQVGDLSQCVDNPALFELILSDLDRNRLTQMTMLLAERGDYPTMARVMEISDKLDTLICNQINESHKKQRLSLLSRPSEDLTIEDLFREADEINRDQNLQVAQLRGKVLLFDQSLSEFQDEPFEKLIQLSEKVELMRQRIHYLMANPPHEPQISGSTTQEPSVSFPSGDGLADTSVLPTFSESVGVAGSVSVPFDNTREFRRTDELIQSDRQFGPIEVVVQVTDEKSASSQNSNDSNSPLSRGGDHKRQALDPLAIERSSEDGVSELQVAQNSCRDVRLMEPVLDNYQKLMETEPIDHDLTRVEQSIDGLSLERHLWYRDIRKKRELFTAWMMVRSAPSDNLGLEIKLIRRNMLAWAMLTRQRRQERRFLLCSIKEWARVSRESKLTLENIHATYFSRSVGPVFCAWSVHALETRNKVFAERMILSERTMRLNFGAWRGLVNSGCMGGAASVTCRRLELSNCCQSGSEEPDAITSAESARPISESAGVLRSTFNKWISLTKLAQSVRKYGETISPLREFGIFATQHEHVPTSPEAWLEEVPQGVREVHESEPSLPDSVEYYVIHDSPNIQSSVDILKTTEAIIAKAQVFLSKRRLNAELKALGDIQSNEIPRTCRKDGAVSDVLTSNLYFTWFEEKWSKERILWYITRSSP